MTCTELATIPAPRRTVKGLSAELEMAYDQKRAVESLLSEVALRLEDAQWQLLRGSGVDSQVDGLKLSTIKAVSRDLRTWIFAGLLKSVADKRFELIYGDGVGFAGLGAAEAFFNSPNNIKRIFSVPALGVASRAHDTDGQIIFVMDKTTKELFNVYIADIEDHYVDGRSPDSVWFVKHVYTDRSKDPDGKEVTVYYPTDECPPEQARKAHVGTGANKVKIDRTVTAFIWDVNRQGGWPYGIPNLVAALEWARRYTEYLKTQAKFAEARASIAWEARAGNSDMAKRMAAVVAQKTIAGTSVATPEMELNEKGGGSEVSFENGRPMAAMVAATSGITTDSMLAVSNTAASQTMDPDTKAMADAMRQSATAFFTRLAVAMGAKSEEFEVIWPDLEDESPFRQAQMIIAAHETGMFENDELRPTLAQRIRVLLKVGSKAPTDGLVPNTKRALQAAQDVLPKLEPASGGGLFGGKKTVANQQGKKTGVGKLSDGDNTARDRGEV